MPLLLQIPVFSPFNSFLRNKNQTIFGWDRAKNVKKIHYGVRDVGEGRLLGVLRYE